MPDFEYNEEEVAREEANYQTPTAQARRAFVRKQLKPTSNESVLSIGCGPGFEPAGFASTRVAKRIVGLDSNPIMLGRARKRCPDSVSLLQGDATALPVADDVFDVAVSVQVYEYIDNLGAALSELYRVLAQDGRAIVYATDWESLVWYADNQERSRRILDEWNDHCVRPQLGSKLRPALGSASFEITNITPYSILLPEMGYDSFAHYLLESIREFVTPRLGEETVNQWVEDLRTRDQCNETFFSLTQFCFLVEPA